MCKITTCKQCKIEIDFTPCHRDHGQARWEIVHTYEVCTKCNEWADDIDVTGFAETTWKNTYQSRGMKMATENQKRYMRTLHIDEYFINRATFEEAGKEISAKKIENAEENIQPNYDPVYRKMAMAVKIAKKKKEEREKSPLKWANVLALALSKKMYVSYTEKQQKDSAALQRRIDQC